MKKFIFFFIGSLAFPTLGMQKLRTLKNKSGLALCRALKQRYPNNRFLNPENAQKKAHPAVSKPVLKFPNCIYGHQSSCSFFPCTKCCIGNTPPSEE